MKPLVLLYWSFLQILLFCDFGERLTGRFDEIDLTLFECNWYTFPMEIQKMLPMLLMSTQSPVVLQGFPNVSCTREAFKKVRFEKLFKKKVFSPKKKYSMLRFHSLLQVANGGFSYFMILRKFR